MILFEDDRWLVVDKPSGWLSIPGRGSEEIPVVTRWLEKEGRKVWVVHRLDLETSGVLLFAKSSEAHREANLWFESHQVAKTYHALVFGIPSAPMAMLKNPIEGKPSATQVEVKKRFKSAALVHAHPQSGRRHQIRIHLSQWGHPILGDSTYNGPSQLEGISIPRVALHAAQLKLPTGQSFQSPHPPDFAAWISELE